MPEPRRSNTVPAFLILLALLCLPMSTAAAEKAEKDEQTTAQRALEARIRTAPLTVSMSTVGRFSAGYGWHLSINSAGQAELTIDTPRAPTRREFVVPERQLNNLRQLLFEQGFFDLKDEYGQSIPDGHTITLAITAGDATKTVKLKFLGNEKSKLMEASHALRVGLMIRAWFDDPLAVDLRKHHSRVLEQAGELMNERKSQ